MAAACRADGDGRREKGDGVGNMVATPGMVQQKHVNLEPRGIIRQWTT